MRLGIIVARLYLFRFGYILEKGYGKFQGEQH